MIERERREAERMERKLGRRGEKERENKGGRRTEMRKRGEEKIFSEVNRTFALDSLIFVDDLASQATLSYKKICYRIPGERQRASYPLPQGVR